MYVCYEQNSTKILFIMWVPLSVFTDVMLYFYNINKPLIKKKMLYGISTNKLRQQPTTNSTLKNPKKHVRNRNWNAEAE